MYYKETRRNDLTDGEMKLATKAFRGKLVRHRFSPPFIINNADDLLGKAREDFARALSRGVEILDPVGFTVHCAWRHTQNLLRSEERTPASVSTEKAAEIADAELPPEELALANDRVRKVQEAISKLNENQRKVVALIFFEDLSWREAAKELGWSASKVQHHHEKAMEHLRRFLAVKSSDDLVIDIGMAAWVSCAGASAHDLPGGFEGLFDKASEGASGLWGKAHELARRLAPGGSSGGGEQIGVLASSGGGRALGACAGVAVACILGGAAAVGPGIGGSGSGDRAGDHRPVISSAKTENPSPQATAVGEVPSTQALPGSTSSTGSQAADSQKHRAEPTGRSPQTESERVEAQASGIARAGAESEDASSSAPTASASSEGTEPEAVTVTSAPSAPASAQEEASVQKQFSAFK